MNLRIETARVYVVTDDAGRRYRRLTRRGACSAAARARVLRQCECEPAEFDENCRQISSGEDCRFHAQDGYGARVVWRLAERYYRAMRGQR